MRGERGYAEQLPDLAGWLKPSTPPVAVIAESGGRREDRQKMILEGWRDAVWSGRYAAVRYDCASPSVAHWINRLAKKVQLTGSAFAAVVQPTAEEIAALVPAADDDYQRPATARERRAEETPIEDPGYAAPDRAASTPQPLVANDPAPETAEDDAEPVRHYRELLGMNEPTSRRRWRR